MLDEAGTIWKRMLAHMMLSRAERQQFYALPAQGPRREEWLMGRLAAKDAARDWYRLNAGVELTPADRSEERRAGKECVSTCRSRWSQEHSKKKHKKQHKESKNRN